MVEEVKARCPRCGTQVSWEENPYRPFCSERCKLIDLGRWVDEQYRINGEKAEDEDYKEDES
ncbi:MAG: DNA gyrase inhibitor YacG [Deltaproteobacteria bacterium]|jgi:endogenous inhibitor of DNA gyrase (YacG/DUF329 family)